MSLYGLTRHFYQYLSDDGDVYQVALTDDDAAAGTFGSPVAANTNPPLPRGWKMRIMYGVNGTSRTKTPMASPAQSDWVTPSAFTKKAVVFAAQGARGECRFNKT